MRTLWLASLLLVTLIAPPLRAESAEAPRQFDIEVILFANLNAYDGGEVWPTELSPERPFLASTGDGQPGETGLSMPGTRVAVDNRWTPLPAADRKLDAIAGALNRSSGYRTLAHLLWRQSVLDPKEALPVDVLALQGYARNEVLPVPHMEGTIQVSVSRYLHVTTDLRMVETARPYSASSMNLIGPDKGSEPVYRMQQKRRMRSGELHYLDHPRFGMLVQITPYTPPAPEPVPAPAQIPEETLQPATAPVAQ